MTFTTANQRRKKYYFLSFIFLKNIFNDLLLTELHHFLSCIVAVCLADARKQQTQKIIHLGNRANSRAGIFISSFLFNGNYRGKSRTLINIRALHIADKLARISAEAFHIPAIWSALMLIRL